MSSVNITASQLNCLSCFLAQNAFSFSPVNLELFLLVAIIKQDGFLWFHSFRCWSELRAIIINRKGGRRTWGGGDEKKRAEMPLHFHCNERQTNNMEVKIILVGFSLNCVLSLNVKLIFPFNFKAGGRKRQKRETL